MLSLKQYKYNIGVVLDRSSQQIIQMHAKEYIS